MEHDTWRTLDLHRLHPSPIAVELFRVAVASYTADVRIARDDAFDRWTRDLVLHLPSSNPSAWDPALPILTELLTFLTGDHWDVRVRRARVARPAPQPDIIRKSLELAADAVCLFSGGLDSLAGAIDQLDSGRRLALVGHNARGAHRFSSPRQTALHQALSAAYGNDAATLLQFWITPDAKIGKNEPTQRGRSILFLTLGALVASALGAGTPLIVPENGFISLNAPLTPGRLGSFSTRTTHPHTLELFEQLLAALGLDVPIEFPYRFLTKGELLAACADQLRLSATARTSNSCAHPNERQADPARPQDHCGYCVPCIIRRTAMSCIGLDNPNDYRFDLHRERSLLDTSSARAGDLVAFETAIARVRSRGTIRPPDVLANGVLPPGQVLEFVDLQHRGLDEISRFLTGQALIP